MKKSRFTEEQMAIPPGQAEGGTSVEEILRKVGVSELRRLSQLEEENRKLKQLVADLSLDQFGSSRPLITSVGNAWRFGSVKAC